MVNHNQSLTIRSSATVGATICAAAALLGAALPKSRAADAPPIEQKKGWESEASVGVTVTRGNSETFLGTVGAKSQRKWSQDEVLLGAAGGYGENTVRNGQVVDHNTTDQYIKGFGQYNHLFTERLYGGIRLEGLYDEIAGIDYRFTLSPLIGYYLIKNKTTFLAVEAGPAFIAENLRGSNANADQYVALRFAERLEHKFSDRAKVWQTAEFLPRISDFNDYIFNFEVGVSAAIAKSLDVRLVLQDSYDNVPAPHRKNNDLKLIAGLGYRF